MAASAIITVRVDPRLLEALRTRAHEQGRSLSAEVVQLLRAELQLPEKPAKKARSMMGAFAQFDAPELADFAKVRAATTSAVKRRVRRRRT